MTRRDLAAQNVLLIRSAEDPDDFADFGATGYYIPPLGTVLTGTNTPTKDDDSTGANNTPGEASFEIVNGKATLGFTKDDDDKDVSDVTTREVEHDPGKEMNEITIGLWEPRGTARFGGARRYHPSFREYVPNECYPRYGTLLISHPIDSSGNPLPVTSSILKADIAECKKVIYCRDVTFKNKNPITEAGEKVRQELSGNFITRQVFLGYEFGAELLAAVAMTGGTPDSLTVQPKIPTRLELVVSVWAAGTEIIIVGTNQRGEAITETVTGISATGTYRTDKVFASVDANGIQPQGSFDATVEINADELY